MNKKRIYIIRHGETDCNKLNITQGQGVDAEINETGRQQALNFFNRYKNLPFDKIYISQAKRTFQSVENFIKLGLPYEKLAGLNEMHWGEYEGKLIDNDLKVSFKAIIDEWKSGNYEAKSLEGENPLQVADRLKKTFDYIVSKTDEQNILICTHGRALLILLCLFDKRELKEMHQYSHANLGLYIVDYDYDAEKFMIELANDKNHLT
jgi:probable phosphoglycerate mutase